MHRYAREAYDMGIRFIGGCCGFEAYHIRAGAEEHEQWGGGLKMHTKPWVRARASREYWENLKPSSGRPFCCSMSKPDAWGVTAGHSDLKQKTMTTTEDEILALQQKKK